jgi:transposase InsO family protein
MNPLFHKKIYHPLIIILYINGMLDTNQLQAIPKTTKHNWNKFKHEDYYGYEWVVNYIDQLDDIKAVFQSRYTKKVIRFMLIVRNAYYNMLKEFMYNKNLLKLNSNYMIESIDCMSSITKLNIKRICKFYGISKDWYYSHKKRLICKTSPIKLCYRQQPNQLTRNEVMNIERVVYDTKNYGKTKTTLYYQALRDQLFYCAKSTFCKYASALGYKNPIRFKAVMRMGIRAFRVFEWLHIDITYVATLNDGIQKVAFVKDNYSKAILHYGSTSAKAGSAFIKTIFQDTFNKFRLFETVHSINILSDGGPENKGEFLSWIKHIKAPPIVNKITARTNEFPFSNNMSESTHRIFKTEFLKGNLSVNRKTHLEDLERFVFYYNYERFPTELYGLSPMEVVEGKIPDRHYFKQHIEHARKDRIRVNQAHNNCISSIGCSID